VADETNQEVGSEHGTICISKLAIRIPKMHKLAIEQVGCAGSVCGPVLYVWNYKVSVIAKT